MTTAEKYLKFMLCVLWADGKVEDGEKALFHSMIENLGIEGAISQECVSYLEPDNPLDLEVTIPQIAENLERTWLMNLVKDAYLMADADGFIHEREVVVVKQLLKEAKVPEEHWDSIHEWALQGLAHMKQGYELFYADLEESRCEGGE